MTECWQLPQYSTTVHWRDAGLKFNSVNNYIQKRTPSLMNIHWPRPFSYGITWHSIGLNCSLEFGCTYSPQKITKWRRRMEERLNNHHAIGCVLILETKQQLYPFMTTIAKTIIGTTTRMKPILHSWVLAPWMKLHLVKHAIKNTCHI